MNNRNINLGAWDKGNTDQVPVYCKFCGYEFQLGDTLSTHMREKHELLYHNCLITAIPEFLEHLAKYVTNDIKETESYKDPKLFEKEEDYG